NSGTTTFSFTVSLSAASSQAISVNYATADGTAATADNDYTAASGTLTIPAGNLSGTVSVSVTGDTKSEPNETFDVNLTGAVNTVMTDSMGLGTILNDDGVPSISISDVTASEGNSGTTSFDFTVSLSTTSSQTITVDYATSDGTATVADNDYAGIS